MVLDENVVEVVQWIAVAIGVPAIGWFWRRHEKEHEKIDEEHVKLWAKTDKLETGMLTASSGLNNRIMEHIDVQISEVKQLVRDEDRKLSEEQATQRGHIGKLFDKIEAHAQRSEDRHNEMMGVLRTMTESFHVALSKKQDK